MPLVHLFLNSSDVDMEKFVSIGASTSTTPLSFTHGFLKAAWTIGRLADSPDHIQTIVGGGSIINLVQLLNSEKTVVQEAVRFSFNFQSYVANSLNDDFELMFSTNMSCPSVFLYDRSRA